VRNQGRVVFIGDTTREPGETPMMVTLQATHFKRPDLKLPIAEKYLSIGFHEFDHLALGPSW